MPVYPICEVKIRITTCDDPKKIKLDDRVDAEEGERRIFEAAEQFRQMQHFYEMQRSSELTRLMDPIFQEFQRRRVRQVVLGVLVAQQIAQWMIRAAANDLARRIALSPFLQKSKDEPAPKKE